MSNNSNNENNLNTVKDFCTPLPSPQTESPEILVEVGAKQIYESIFPTCYYGCKLDPKTQKWDCKRSVDFNTANNYALSSNKYDGKDYPTRIIPTSCHNFLYPEFIQRLSLYHSVNFDIGPIVQDDYNKPK